MRLVNWHYGGIVIRIMDEGLGLKSFLFPYSIMLLVNWHYGGIVILIMDEGLGLKSFIFLGLMCEVRFSNYRHQKSREPFPLKGQ